MIDGMLLDKTKHGTFAQLSLSSSKVRVASHHLVVATTDVKDLCILKLVQGGASCCNRLPVFFHDLCDRWHIDERFELPIEL